MTLGYATLAVLATIAPDARPAWMEAQAHNPAFAAVVELADLAPL